MTSRTHPNFAKTAAVLFIFAGLSACGSPRFVRQPEPPAPVEQTVQVQAETVAVSQPQVDLDALRLLSQVEQMQIEMQTLRDQIEIQGYELEKLKRRQRDLYDDLDARLLENERSASLTRPAAAGSASGEFGANQTAGAMPQPPSTRVNNAGAVIVDDSSSRPAAGTAATQVDTVSVVPASASPEGEQAYYEQAFDLLKKSRYGDAVGAFRAQLGAYPNGDLADDAQYWIGEAQYVTRAFEQALNAFQTLASRYPESSRVPDALLKTGYIQYEVGAYGDARQTFAAVIGRYPGSRVAISAQTRLAKMDRENLY